MRQRLLLILLLVLPVASLAAPQVVATIKPLQLIATEVVGPEQPVALLIDPRQSHHDYQLRPSERRLLATADVVFWIGPELESYLRRTLAALDDGVRVEALGRGGADSNHAHVEHAADHHHHAGRDPHYWLSPPEAVRMARHMAKVLGARDPAHAALYRDNAERFAVSAQALDARLATRFAALAAASRPYLVMHDAYGHFEERYGLTRAATYVETPEQQPGARHMVELRSQLQRGELRCVLREPTSRAGPLEAALAGVEDVRVVDLDLLGAEVTVAPGAYVTFLQRFADDVAACLQPGPIAEQ